jgi:peptidoglycan/LPS O-acetylase OafA/YrhL
VAPRLHLLDALRGIAALAVVFWHWQHFGAGRPLETLFWPFYHGGGHAVEFFFLLSGAIFYWLYAQRLPSARIFFWLRFSRLYPLHLLAFLAILGHPFIYPQEGTHALLHLTLTNGWAPGHSFNAPAWSISVECFLYAVFYLTVRQGLTRPADLALLIFIGLIFPVHQIGQGLTYFFAGGLLATTFNLKALDFPWARRLAPLGDISYSIYLLHFPLQAAFAAFLPRAFFSTPLALLSFFSVLIPLSVFTFHYFERPSQHLIRRLALG